MQTIKELLKYGKDSLMSISDTPQLDAEILLGYVLEMERLHLLMQLNDAVDLSLSEAYISLIKRRTSYEPIAYIVQSKEFWGLEFYVDENVLIPRPDSEVLIETVMRYFPDKSRRYQILDLGSGSGALGISLLREYRHASCDFVDLHMNALSVASLNAINLGVAERAFFIKSNWFENCSQKRYDIIICNPPYIGLDEGVAIETSKYEPHTALYAIEDGLKDYKIITSELDQHLNPGGILFLELGINKEQVVKKICVDHGLTVMATENDLSGIPRCMVVGKKNSDNI